jgi:hypothetical protein
MQSDSPSNAFETEVADRFGLLPNFFRSAKAAPELIQQLWGFAKAGYLDNPMPSVFKERLFVGFSEQFAAKLFEPSRRKSRVAIVAAVADSAWGSQSPAGWQNCKAALLLRPAPDSTRERLLRASAE